MTQILRIMPDKFAGFSREDALRQLAEEQKAEAERLKQEAERAAAEKKGLEDLARGNASKEQVVVPVSGVVLDNIEFGPSSDEQLNQPGAVAYAKNFGILQSAGEAVLARKKINDDTSWNYQRTRTGAFYVIEHNRVCVVFDDIADYDKNVVLNSADFGFRLNKDGEELRIGGIDDVLKRARDTDSIFEVPKNLPVEASVVGSPCEYETNPYFVAVLGKEMASLNAELIRRKGRNKGYLDLMSASDVSGTFLRDTSRASIIVRPVGLGIGIDDVYANDYFSSFGSARGVRYVPDDTP